MGKKLIPQLVFLFFPFTSLLLYFFYEETNRNTPDLLTYPINKCDIRFRRYNPIEGYPVLARPLAYTTEQWIEKVRQVHGDKFDYSGLVYTGSQNTVQYNCPKHGVITQKAKKHLEGHGCKKCATESQRKGIQKFIEQAREVHDDFYDYSLVKFKSIHDKVKIICPRHGIFEQKPAKHQKGQGCKFCKGREVWDQKSFLEKAYRVHGTRYDYSNVEYRNTVIKIEITCNECGLQFSQTPNSHLGGSGCPGCNQPEQLTDDMFREKLEEVHGKEIIALEEYKGSDTSIKFKHFCGHKWKNRPGNVIGKRKQGCPRCSVENRTMTQEEFERKLSKRHRGRIVVLDQFQNTKTPIRVKHLDCGKIWKVAPRVSMRHGCHNCANRKSDEEFRAELEETHNGEIVALEPYKTVRDNIRVKHVTCGHEWRPNPTDLIGKFHGCPKCASSKGNQKIDSILSKKKINFIREQRFESCSYKIPLPFDFYLPKFDALIEFDGAQHFKVVEYWGGEEGLQERILKDEIKNEWCHMNSKRLYRIRFDQDVTSRMREILKELGS